jgi:hypothetical protein
LTDPPDQASSAPAPPATASQLLGQIMLPEQRTAGHRERGAIEHMFEI